MRRGPGTNKQQIESLRAKMSVSDIELAMHIVQKDHPNVISLAHKLMRANVAKNKLPKSVTDLIAKLPPEEAKAFRDRLLEVRV